MFCYCGGLRHVTTCYDYRVKHRNQQVSDGWRVGKGPKTGYDMVTCWPSVLGSHSIHRSSRTILEMERPPAPSSMGPWKREIPKVYHPRHDLSGTARTECRSSQTPLAPPPRA